MSRSRLFEVKFVANHVRAGVVTSGLVGWVSRLQWYALLLVRLSCGITQRRASTLNTEVMLDFWSFKGLYVYWAASISQQPKLNRADLR